MFWRIEKLVLNYVLKEIFKKLKHIEKYQIY